MRFEGRPSPSELPPTAETDPSSASVAPTRVRGIGIVPALVVLLGIGIAVAGVAGRLAAPAPPPPVTPFERPDPVPAASPPAPAEPALQIALLGIDLPPAIGSYEASRVLATLDVFGRVVDPAVGELTAELLDEDPAAILGSTTATPAADGRFRTTLPFVPPIGGSRVVLALRDGAGDTLATVPYLIRTQGSIVFRRPDRLVGWRAGDRVEVRALVLGGPSRAVVRIRTEDDRIVAAQAVPTRPWEDGWAPISAALTIPDGLPFGRAWLEIETPGRGDEPAEVARLLLRVSH